MRERRGRLTLILPVCVVDVVIFVSGTALSRRDHAYQLFDKLVRQTYW